MRGLAEIYRIGIGLCAILFVLAAFFSIPQLQDYSSSNDIRAYVTIGTSVIGLLLLGPSAILLAIMDDIRVIREGRPPKEIEEKASPSTKEETVAPPTGEDNVPSFAKLNTKKNGNKEKLEPKL